MTTRYNIKRQSRFGVSPLATGFDSKSSPDDITIPSVGLEDVDVALFNLFDDEIPFQVKTDNDMKKVPVIFAVGEKWAMLKQGRALRDRNNSLILPLITIGRNTVQQASDSDIAGRGINQQTGDIVVKRKLDKSDRSYQNLINRLLLENQTNLAVATSADPAQLTSERILGELKDDPTVVQGGLLLPDRQDNVYEIVVVPAPQFHTLVYEVVFWTQYTQHMNQLLEQVLSSFLPQGNAWRLDTPKGYWFVATVEGNEYAAENNFDDMALDERIVKYKFTVKVPAYVLASPTPGAPVPVRRYLSSPSITFDVSDSLVPNLSSTSVDPFLGADDPTLPTALATRRNDQRDVNDTRLFPGTKENVDDPATVNPPNRYRKIVGINSKGKQVTRYVKVVTTNKFTGETLLAPDAVLGGLSIVTADD